MGVPLVIIQMFMGVSMINHPAIGVLPSSLQTPWEEDGRHKSAMAMARELKPLLEK